MIPLLVHHFDRKRGWSLLYFLNYAYYDNYLAQSQILVISLYIEISRETTRAWGKKAPSEFEPIQ
jgi:hypothetical protein